MEDTAELDGDRRVAVPAELEHLAVGSEQLEGGLQTGRRAGGVHDEVEVARRVAGTGEAHPQRRRHRGSRPVDVDECHRRSRDTGQQARDAAADHPRAHHRDPVADQRPGVPQCVDRRLDRAGQHRPRRWDAVRDDGDRARRDDVRRLVRVEAEDRAPFQAGRPTLDHADVEVAVLDRPREVALLEGRAHRGVLALGHPATEHQRLGSAADAAVQRAHEHLVGAGLRQSHRADLATPRPCHPERRRRRPVRCPVGRHAPPPEPKPSRPREKEGSDPGRSRTRR